MYITSIWGAFAVALHTAVGGQKLRITAVSPNGEWASAAAVRGPEAHQCLAVLTQPAPISFSLMVSVVLMKNFSWPVSCAARSRSPASNAASSCWGPGPAVRGRGTHPIP